MDKPEVKIIHPKVQTVNAVEVLTFIIVLTMMSVAVIDMIYSIIVQKPSLLFGITLTYKDRDNTEL